MRNYRAAVVRVEAMLAERAGAGATVVAIDRVRASLAEPPRPEPVRPSRFVPPPPPAREYPPDDGSAGYVISSNSLIVHRGDCSALVPRRGNEAWNMTWTPEHADPRTERACKRCLPGGLPQPAGKP